MKAVYIEAHGDAVSIGGEVSIDGRVTGDVVAVGGDVELGPDAEITGDVVSIGGEVQRETGAVVHGDVVEMAWADMDWEWGNWFGDWDGDWFPSIGYRPSFFRLGKALDFVWAIVFTGVLIALAGLVLLIAPRGVDRVRSAVVADPWILLVVGIGVEILLIPVLVVATLILLVTVIGIPFAVLLWPVAFVAFALALVLGYTGSAAAAGEWCRNRFRDASRVAGGSFGALALGVLTIQALALAADLLGFLGLPWFFRVMFWFPGFLICYAAWTIGLGGVVMTRFGSHGYGETAPASPPPAPAAPGDAGAAAGAADAANEPPPGDGSDESPAEPPKPPTA